LYIHYTHSVDSTVEKKLIQAFRRVGYLSATRLSKYPTPGASVHYAGTLPMPHVYVIDGAVFPALPAKNLSFTIMANAMRVAANLLKDPA